MRLIFSPRAARRLREIQAYLAFAASLNTALRVVLRIRQSAEMLTDFPAWAWSGKAARHARCASLVCPTASTIGFTPTRSRSSPSTTTVRSPHASAERLLRCFHSSAAGSAGGAFLKAWNDSLHPPQTPP